MYVKLILGYIVALFFDRSEEQENETNSNEVKAHGQGDAVKTPLRSPALEAVQKLISLTPPTAPTTPTSSKTVSRVLF